MTTWTKTRLKILSLKGSWERSLCFIKYPYLASTFCDQIPPQKLSQRHSKLLALHALFLCGFYVTMHGSKWVFFQWCSTVKNKQMFGKLNDQHFIAFFRLLLWWTKCAATTQTMQKEARLKSCIVFLAFFIIICIMIIFDLHRETDFLQQKISIIMSAIFSHTKNTYFLLNIHITFSCFFPYN